MTDSTPSTTEPARPEPPTFTDEQRARAKALDAARAIMKETGFASSRVTVSPTDLVDLANYILTGRHPLDGVDLESATDVEEVPAGADD